jgi:hypothetical protein
MIARGDAPAIGDLPWHFRGVAAARAECRGILRTFPGLLYRPLAIGMPRWRPCGHPIPPLVTQRCCGPAGAARRSGRSSWKRWSPRCGAARLTDGDVDPTVGHSLVLAGYDPDFGAVTASPHAVKAVRAPGWRVVEVDPDAGTVRVPLGVVLDLESARRRSRCSRGGRAPPAAASWSTSAATSRPPGRRRPADGSCGLRTTMPRRPAPRVRIDAGALATSSTAVRRWRRGAMTLHHILDPARQSTFRRSWSAAPSARGCPLPPRSPWRSTSASSAAMARRWAPALSSPPPPDAGAAARAAGPRVSGTAHAPWQTRLRPPRRR